MSVSIENQEAEKLERFREQAEDEAFAADRIAILHLMEGFIQRIRSAKAPEDWIAMLFVEALRRPSTAEQHMFRHFADTWGVGLAVKTFGHALTVTK